MKDRISRKDFFSKKNAVDRKGGFPYENFDLIIETIKSMERSTYHSFYIVDYMRKGFLYVSENISHLCGVDAAMVKKAGYKFYVDNVPEEDLEMLLEVNSSGFDLFNTFPVAERRGYALSCNFHIRDVDGVERLVNHKLSPLLLNEDGKIVLAICTISLAACNIPGQFIMKKTGEDTFYEYSFDRHCWIKRDEIVLSEMEREIIYLSTQGYTMAEIAKKLCKSVDTVKTHRRNVFKKMNVKNIAEAVMYAINHNMIFNPSRGYRKKK